MASHGGSVSCEDARATLDTYRQLLPWYSRLAEATHAKTWSPITSRPPPLPCAHYPSVVRDRLVPSPAAHIRLPVRTHPWDTCGTLNQRIWANSGLSRMNVLDAPLGRQNGGFLRFLRRELAPRSGGRVVMQRTANPRMWVRFPPGPPGFTPLRRHSRLRENFPPS